MTDVKKVDYTREIKDYLTITLGVLCYAFSWSAFLLPYQITTGGVVGISSIVYYAIGVPIQYTNLAINAALMIFAFRILGSRFTIRTSYGILSMTFFLWFFQALIMNDDGTFPQVLGEGQEFMACIIGAAICGMGLGLVFNSDGSTGGTDIVAAIVNKYRDITLGRTIMYCDIIIVSSSFLIFEDWRRVIFGFVTLFISNFVLDWVVNSARQSVQFFIFSKHYEQIAMEIQTTIDKGSTVLTGKGWYTQNEVKILFVLAKQSQSVEIFRLIKDIDPDAFISQSEVIGVYGKGFDRIKVSPRRRNTEKKNEEK